VGAKRAIGSMAIKRDGAPDTIRTCGLHLRRVALYPAELRVHRCSDSARDRAGSISNSTIESTQSERGLSRADCRRSYSTTSFRFASVVLPRPRTRYSSTLRVLPIAWFRSIFTTPSIGRKSLRLPSEGRLRIADSYWDFRCLGTAGEDACTNPVRSAACTLSVVSSAWV
jgi:hypothetical protein